MIRNDYILRLIESFGAFLARLMRRVDRGELAEAKEEADAMARSAVGLPLAVLESNPPDGLEALLATSAGPDYPRIMAAAVVLDARGRIAHREADEITAFRLWSNAATLLLTGTRSPDEEVKARCLGQLDDVIRRLHEFELPAFLHLALAEHHEQTGELSRAEDHLHEGLEEHPDRGELLRGFYKRLERLTDAELETGNLSRDEVLESLSELSRNGRH